MMAFVPCFCTPIVFACTASCFKKSLWRHACQPGLSMSSMHKLVGLPVGMGGPRMLCICASSGMRDVDTCGSCLEAMYQKASPCFLRHSCFRSSAWSALCQVGTTPVVGARLRLAHTFWLWFPTLMCSCLGVLACLSHFCEAGKLTAFAVQLLSLHYIARSRAGNHRSFRCSATIPCSARGHYNRSPQQHQHVKCEAPLLCSSFSSLSGTDVDLANAERQVWWQPCNQCFASTRSAAGVCAQHGVQFACVQSDTERGCDRLHCPGAGHQQHW